VNQVAIETNKDVRWFGTRHNQFDAVDRPEWLHVEARHGDEFDDDGNLVSEATCQMADQAKLLGEKGWLVGDLRLLALAEAGQLSLEKRTVDLGDLVRDAQVNFSPQASDRGITLVLDLSGTLSQVEGDWRRISQVLGNLLTNALRHTPQGGIVTLSAVAREQEVEVVVADTGTGIPLEDQTYVFERFWRGEKSRLRVSGGTGLGLAIAKQIVELHGGRIWLESVPGKGSTFRFTLSRT